MTDDDVFQQTLSEDGYAMGSDPCLDQCWADFQQCLKVSNSAAECLAHLQTCKRICALKLSGADAESQSDDSATA